MPVKKLSNGKWVIIGHEDAGQWPTRRHAESMMNTMDDLSTSEPEEREEKERDIIQSLKKKITGDKRPEPDKEDSTEIEEQKPEPEKLEPEIIKGTIIEPEEPEEPDEPDMESVIIEDIEHETSDNNGIESVLEDELKED